RHVEVECIHGGEGAVTLRESVQLDHGVEGGGVGAAAAARAARASWRVLRAQLLYASSYAVRRICIPAIGSACTIRPLSSIHPVRRPPFCSSIRHACTESWCAGIHFCPATSNDALSGSTNSDSAVTAIVVSADESVAGSNTSYVKCCPTLGCSPSAMIIGTMVGRKSGADNLMRRLMRGAFFPAMLSDSSVSFTTVPQAR